MKISKRIIIWLFAAFLLLAAAGCGEGGGTPAADMRHSSSASLQAPVPEKQAPEAVGQEAQPVGGSAVCTIAIYGDGDTIMEPVQVEFKDGDSVLDILKKVTWDSKIQMEYRGGEKSGAYVEGIDNLYEFDRGAESGWMYNVNGSYPNYGCGVYKVEKGDRIEWRYTKDLGKDLGADMSGTD
jgi:hypothetical protein